MSTSSTSESGSLPRGAAGSGEIGFGVRIQRKGDELRVLSRELSLGWHSSGPGSAGTAVRFEGEIWETHLFKEGAQGEFWQLRRSLGFVMERFQ